ncbi:MAG: site-2 protease family protein [Pyrinomonadaceae bacterium]
MTRFSKFFSKKLLVTRIKSIPVFIDYRWFFVVAILVWITAATFPDSITPIPAVKIALSFIAIIVFFVCIFLHELAHAYVARKQGLQVVEILLHPFGGIARLRHEPDNPKDEFKIAIAGPIASLLIAAMFLVFTGLSTLSGMQLLTPLFFALFLLNFLLGVFNLFPGYPLDGGRVLRAILWRRGKNFNDATIITGKFGQVIAVVLIFFGIVSIFLRYGLFTGIWTIVVGIYLFDSARKIISRINRFEHQKIEEIMEMPVAINPEKTVMEFVDTTLSIFPYEVFAVSQQDELYGFLHLRDLKNDFPREVWHTTLVQDAMRPISEGDFVESDAEAAFALALLNQNKNGVLGVIDNEGKLLGILRKGKIRFRK